AGGNRIDPRCGIAVSPAGVPLRPATGRPAHRCVGPAARRPVTERLRPPLALALSAAGLHGPEPQPRTSGRVQTPPPRQLSASSTPSRAPSLRLAIRSEKIDAQTPRLPVPSAVRQAESSRRTVPATPRLARTTRPRPRCPTPRRAPDPGAPVVGRI